MVLCLISDASDLIIESILDKFKIIEYIKDMAKTLEDFVITKNLPRERSFNVWQRL